MSTADIAEKIAGSFSAYLLRPLLSGNDKDKAQAVSDALNASAISARQYISAYVVVEETKNNGDN